MLVLLVLHICSSDWWLLWEVRAVSVGKGGYVPMPGRSPGWRCSDVQNSQTVVL